jgi:hypothetical protein
MIALTAMVLAAPVMLAVALLIKAPTGGPAIYSHSHLWIKPSMMQVPPVWHLLRTEGAPRRSVISGGAM